MTRAFMIKQKAFFITFKGLLLKQNNLFGKCEPDFKGTLMQI